MNIIARIFILAIFIGSISCTPVSNGYNFEYGSLPETPVNLADFNTEYDDYNSTAPSLGRLIPFCFSTNRNSQGNEFDIIYQPMNVNFDKTSGLLKVTNEYDNWGIYENEFDIIGDGLIKIKSDGNEFGPNLLFEQNSTEEYFTLLYSTDKTGNSQINYISTWNNSSFSEPKEVGFLNSQFDDMYPTFNSDNTKIYFCSNRGGESFNFYYVGLKPGLSIEQVLSDTSSYDAYIDSDISSSSDDKCPCIFGDKMVFTSNREGGFGGYDLYYSIFEAGKWGDPINFGEEINTEFDEYRPILINDGVSLTQTMMVFSSNRTGGKGGFDLYFVGIEN